MKKLLRFGYVALAVSFLALSTSCEENEELIPDEEDEFAAEMILEEGMGDVTKTVYISDINPDSTSFDVSVTFKSTNKKMRRVYMTENIAGAGIEPYELLLDGLDKKGDGSLDVESKQGNEFTFKLPFNVLSTVTSGTVEYQIWATSGKGDYRDTANSVVTGVGTLIVNYGGTNPATQLKEYTAKLFVVPLSDGTSKTFISVLNGELYRLSEGEEYASFWDFGYYWLPDPGASLSSTYDYPALFDHDSDAETDLVAISGLTGVDQAELNHCYFMETTLGFDASTHSNDLSSLDFSEVSDERIKNLSVGKIVAFQDGYGKKGLIRVTEINPGYGSDGSMTIDIKVQP